MRLIFRLAAEALHWIQGLSFPGRGFDALRGKNWFAEENSGGLLL
jgi:hypothetical protein